MKNPEQPHPSWYDDTVDPQEEQKLLLKAERGDMEAQFYLADFYEARLGESDHEKPDDEKRAFKWHRKAAEQGHAESACKLGNIYREGGITDLEGITWSVEGVTHDPDAARKWYEKAATLGDDIAAEELEDLAGKA